MERAERLRAALKENLKRRKAQARGRAAPPGEGAGAGPEPAGDPAPDTIRPSVPDKDRRS